MAPGAASTVVEAIPAVDLLGGEVVRLHRGERRRKTAYGDDPLAAAERFAAAGARRLHVVDLDGAFGDGANTGAVRRLLAESGLSVQVAGGVRTLAAFAALREAGAARVVFGTAAVETPAVVEAAARRDPGGVAVALDVRAGRLRTRGWVAAAGAPSADVSDDPSGDSPGDSPGDFGHGWAEVEAAARRWAEAGAAELIYTRIERDGTLEGPDVAGALRVAAASGASTLLAGGIGTTGHLREVAAAAAPTGERLRGVVLGRALYEERFTLAEARTALGAG